MIRNGFRPSAVKDGQININCLDARHLSLTLPGGEVKVLSGVAALVETVKRVGPIPTVRTLPHPDAGHKLHPRCGSQPHPDEELHRIPVRYHANSRGRHLSPCRSSLPA